MTPDEPPPAPGRAVRLARVVSGAAVGVALAVSAAALLAHFGVNAEGAGAHDAGTALFLSVFAALALAGAFHAVVPLLLLALPLFFVDRPSALRLLLAAALCAAPPLLLDRLA